ncbi:MAG: peptidase S1 [Actinobacteria bacterium]|nr:MAG: peptidase S1 [Actinomycetota bacterium]
MSEHETNLQRPTEPAEPSPTSELPRAEQGWSDAGAVGGATADEPTRVQPAHAHPAQDQPAPGQSAYGQPTSSEQPTAGNPWQSPYAGPPHPPFPGRPFAGAHAPQSGPAPGQPGSFPPPPPYPGVGPMAAWGPPPAPRPGASRAAKLLGAGAVALVLMVGSGVAGGAVALSLADRETTEKTASTSAPAPVINRSSLAEIAAKVQDSVVSIATGSSEGSGVILSADGYILTNNHVVASAGQRAVTVYFSSGKSTRARIVGTDPKTDLAVIKAEGVSNLSPATFGDSDAMQVGDTVLAIGSPLGLQGSVTAGIISAENRTIQTGGSQNPFQPGGGRITISGLLQTDAPINPGNSGGPLVNTKAEVIGINTAIATSGHGQGNIGLGFAIPSNKAKVVAEALRKGEKISHPFIGVSVTRAPSGGALISAVTPNGPAERAGLQTGDIVTRFGDKEINDSDELVAAVQSGKVGDRVQVTYIRDGETRTTTVTLAEAP